MPRCDTVFLFCHTPTEPSFLTDPAMAVPDPPAGLMDIASTIAPDEIPFKLRCAICSKLAVNAFRLPCCDQSICETCQASLHDTCPVCAHTPVSPDLCKPNKALRTTLKAFLRTEEKKREKDRQAAAPPTPSISAPAKNDTPSTEVPNEQSTVDQSQVDEPSAPEPSSHEATEEADSGNPAESIANASAAEPTQISESDPIGDQANETAKALEEVAPPADNVPVESEPLPQDGPTADPSMNSMGPGGFLGMGWNGNANFNMMNPFMGNPMFNFPNPMGMPMTMDPMAANQGMFGDYGMNMTGMGMNMGMNFNGQGMYGSIGWDGSQQNMWRGQDKFNPNAFANGKGPPYGGGAFGGSNMSYPTNGDFQSSYQGHDRGGFRGRGRGHFQGPGRGGFHAGQSTFASNESTPEVNGAPIKPNAADTEIASQTDGTEGNTESTSIQQQEAGNDGQLHGIPTIDSLDQPMPTGPNVYQGGPGYGSVGYMRGAGFGARGGFGGGPMASHQANIEPKGPGVEGAPAAPRAMRQGLPNTSVLRQRGFHNPGRASISSTTPTQGGNSEVAPEQTRTRSSSKVPSQAPQGHSRSRSASRSRSRSRSPSTREAHGDRNKRRDRETRHSEYASNGRREEDRSRSISRPSSRRSSRRRHQDSDRDRRGHRSTRSRRHSRSPSGAPRENGDSRHPDRLNLIVEDQDHNGSNKPYSETGESHSLSNRISGSRRSSRDRHSRREEDRARDRESRRRHRDRRDRDRDPDRTRHRARDRDRDRVRERERDRGQDRDSDRKRSRRDRSESANVGERSYSRDRRAKRVREDRDRDRQSPRPGKSEPEKDPHTLEREARNRERLLREKQRREQAKSGSRRDSRQERVVAGRRINFKYEDEL
ncbi:hypothetical protein N7492_003152 [Penicillium capsulatum]|uniref:RING-type domain-containing protein n=1 Tax=Penicillium capsulatum TaxID=69766 RepID=A0A9W9ILB9_9EURO|nr:hypothetical protein N7492_003152 [Penicillium capsulatum]